MTRNQLAALRGCSPQTVSRHHLPHIKEGKYDLSNPEVQAFVIEPYLAAALREEHRKKPTDPQDMDSDDLEAEKLRAEIEYKNRQVRKLDLFIAREKRELIPSDLMAIWIGHFSSGVRNNFLSIGNRIARGNVKLRDRIEKEIKKAIEKTLAGAASSLRKESKGIIDAMEES